VIAALLGADRFGFGTLPLLALGCKMVRQCHLNTCPVGIATQDEDLRAKYTGSVEQVVELFRLLAEDVRAILARMGVTRLESITGYADLLRASGPGSAQDFVALLARAELGEGRPFREIARSPLGEILTGIGRSVVEGGKQQTVSFPIQNTERSVGTRLSGEISERRGKEGLAADSFTIRLSGTAGQSFGAFLADGIALDLDGVGNDYVGKGMGGGVISIHPSAELPNGAHVAGNACLYGATGGRLFAAGSVGQRFAVRNSGATAVIEGSSDHLAEYMTGGFVVVLGDVGRNIAAGMTGGTLVLYDPSHRARSRIAESAPPLRRLDDAIADRVLDVLTEHVEHTGSNTAGRIIDRWQSERQQFWVCRPDPSLANDATDGEAVDSETVADPTVLSPPTGTPDTVRSL
jgi:glutamate synthase domain-containing protein 3